jgi:hypothetical protein
LLRVVDVNSFIVVKFVELVSQDLTDLGGKLEDVDAEVKADTAAGWIVYSGRRRVMGVLGIVEIDRD